MERKQILNISERSGVSRDYKVALGTVYNFIKRVDEVTEQANRATNRGIYLAKNSLRDKAILRYEEFFTPAEYEDAVTDRNRANVSAINEVVNALNETRMQIGANNENLAQEYEVIKSLAGTIDTIISKGIEALAQSEQ